MRIATPPKALSRRRKRFDSIKTLKLSVNEFLSLSPKRFSMNVEAYARHRVDEAYTSEQIAKIRVSVERWAVQNSSNLIVECKTLAAKFLCDHLRNTFNHQRTTGPNLGEIEGLSNAVQQVRKQLYRLSKH